MKITSFFTIVMPPDIQLHPEKAEIQGCQLTVLEGRAFIQDSETWGASLYRPLSSSDSLSEVRIRLIPYFAWGNRGRSEMSVWMPVTK